MGKNSASKSSLEQLRKQLEEHSNDLRLHQLRINNASVPKNYCQGKIGTEIAGIDTELHAIGITQIQNIAYQQKVKGEVDSGGFLSGVGAAAVGAGAMALMKSNKKKEKKTASSASDTEDATVLAQHAKMVESCTGANSTNTNTVECANHFTAACLSKEGQSKEGCTSFNNEFCGTSLDSNHTGFNTHVQYCTLVQTRSHCDGSNNQNSPSCQWVRGLNATEACQKNPLQGTCLPRFSSAQSLQATCSTYNKDPMCYRVLNGSTRFTVGYGHSEGNNNLVISAEEYTNNLKPDQQEASPQTRSPASQSTTHSGSDTSTSNNSDIQNAFSGSGNILTSASPTRLLCSQGALYNCE